MTAPGHLPPYGPEERSRFRFSLRNLLIGVTVVAVVLGLSTLAGGMFRFLLMMVMMGLVLPALAAVAAYGRGHRQAFALGVLVATVAYWYFLSARMSIWLLLWWFVIAAVAGLVCMGARLWIRQQGWDEAD